MFRPADINETLECWEASLNNEKGPSAIILSRQKLNYISKLPEKLFGINYDTGNSAALGYNSSEEFFEYGKRIINIHIKDRKFNGQTVPLMEGDADFKKIFKGLNDLRYKGDFILQTARALDGNHSEVIKNYQTFVSEEFFGKFK